MYHNIPYNIFVFKHLNNNNIMYNNLMCSMLVCELRFIQIKNLYRPINTKIKGEYRLKYYTTRSYPGNCGSVIRPPSWRMQAGLQKARKELWCASYMSIGTTLGLVLHCLQDEYVPSGQHERLVGTTSSRPTGRVILSVIASGGI